MLFPADLPGATAIDLEDAGPGDDSAMPRVLWTGVAEGDLAVGVPPVENRPGAPLLAEHAHELLTRPHLRGHRATPGGTGRSWTTRFVVRRREQAERTLRIEAADEAAGLELVVELESLAGGSLRGRATLTNVADGFYALDGLELCLPVGDGLTEVLDFTGRHERERVPQRHEVVDGLWLRESRGGRPGLDAATQVVVGTPGLSTTRGEAVACHVAWSGNSVLRVERGPGPMAGTTVGGGELLQPGEITLRRGEAYTTPWVMWAAANDGLDGVAASWHAWQRTLPTRPDVQPVVLNVWEAVYFEHDLDHLRRIADRAARVGVERFVLDDGWFGHRRDDTAGLGDWWVDPAVWPEGLGPLVDHVTGLGMEFGLWFEPEMVNPDSDLYREHPEWILSSGDREPVLHRHQQVLDLSRPEVVDHLFERVDAILSAYDIGYVKWDHNRDLIEAGSGARDGAPVPHDQTVGYLDLLDRLRAAHPDVAWESCASGGGRIDLGTVEHVQRFWTSDMTDALARQQIQRWTTQLVAPELLGAHVNAPTSHSTWRTHSLDFRAATAMFGAFGIEWDLMQADEDDLDRLAGWVQRHKDLRPLLHSGRVVRPESSDPTVLLHGVVGDDEALVAHVALDESAHNRGVWVRVPGLDPEAAYDLTWEGPVAERAASKSAPYHPDGPTGGEPVSGRALAARGFWMPRSRPETIVLVHLTRH